MTYVHQDTEDTGMRKETTDTALQIPPAPPPTTVNTASFFEGVEKYLLNANHHAPNLIVRRWNNCKYDRYFDFAMDKHKLQYSNLTVIKGGQERKQNFCKV